MASSPSWVNSSRAGGKKGDVLMRIIANSCIHIQIEVTWFSSICSCCVHIEFESLERDSLCGDMGIFLAVINYAF